MQTQLFTRLDAERAKTKNIIEISFDFSAMARVFAKESGRRILERLEAFFSLLISVDTKATYDILHAEFCEWFITNIRTAEKNLRSGRNVASGASSYGQAAKVLNVATKVYVYYCSQPSWEDALRLVPFLHAALDTDMMRELYSRSPDTLREVDRAQYELLQILVARAIGETGIHPVQYDDLMWRKLQRANG